MRYSNVIFLAAALASSSASVRAADWAGAYVGLNSGLGWSDATWLNRVSTPAATFFDYTPGRGFAQNLSGILGGGQVGYNFQNGPWVLGVEAMFDGSAIKGDFTSKTPFGAGDDQFNARLDALFLGTGRIGYAWSEWLAYVKAGYAAGRIRLSVTDSGLPTTGSGSDAQWRSGPTFGLGIEYRLTSQLSVAAEYDYVRLGSGTYQLGGGSGNYLWDVRIRDINLITMRLNCRFGGGP